ncbi:LuxR C-terminal-related transcriptional regulator [Streptomyces sp. NPDC057376]|uniref:helix-turn-helix domain-containing protein n=1 Tax=unclassified Streptomyces TaxID=2593676 RepID=UPI001F523771|nr:helix-turn-helix transcriptional regulator [Streptomyces sp. CB02414]
MGILLTETAAAPAGPDQLVADAGSETAMCGCEGPPTLSFDTSGVSRLTGREREVLLLVAAALPNGTIARRLGIAERTVKAHVSSIVEKLRVASRLEAALLVHLHHELICPE